MSEYQEHSNTPAPIAAPPSSPSRLSGIIFFILCATLVFSVGAFGAVDLWALGVLSLLSGSIAVLWLADAWFRKEFQFNLNSLQIPLLGLVAVGLIQLLPLRRPEIPADLLSIPAAASLSLAPYATRLATVQLIVYFIFFAAALAFINNENRLRKIVLTIIIFGSSMAFFGILQRLADLEAIYGLRLPGQAVPFASFVNQHHFAALMEMTIGVTLGLLFSRETKNNRRIFLSFAALVMGVAVVFTSSRGGMISLIAVIGFIVAANILQKSANDTNFPDGGSGKSNRRVFAFIGGGVGLIAVLFGATLLLDGDESLLRGAGLSNPDEITNGRLHFWSIAWRIFLDHPLLGAGLDSFAFAFTAYDTWNGTYRIEQAHNDYLQILADAGIAGFVCAAAFIFLLFKHGRRAIRQSADSFRRSTATGALAGCAGILIHSFFDFPLRTPANAFFFLTLTALAVVSIAPPKKSSRRRRRKE